MREGEAPCLLDFSGSAGSCGYQDLMGRGTLEKKKKAALSPSMGHLQQRLLPEGLLTTA